jgi:hypothetical protein
MSKGNSGCGSFPYSGLDLSKAINDGKTPHAPKLDDDGSLHRIYPKLEVGDRLWVREAWQYIEGASGRGYAYKAGGGVHNDTGRWRPSIHMPRTASRITLEVVSVTAERLQDITEEDAIAEGIVPDGNHTDDFAKKSGCFVGAYSRLWDSIYAKRGLGWDTNPYVWRIGFKVLEVRG